MMKTELTIQTENSLLGIFMGSQVSFGRYLSLRNLDTGELLMVDEKDLSKFIDVISRMIPEIKKFMDDA